MIEQIDITDRPTQPLETPSSEYAVAIAHLRLALPAIESVSDHMACVTRIIIEELEERAEESAR